MMPARKISYQTSSPEFAKYRGHLEQSYNHTMFLV